MLDYTDIKFFKLAVGQDRIGHETEIDINAKCPICGDSRIHQNVKRLHLYQKGDVTLVNCFNGDCPCQNKTMYNFLKTFYPNLLFQYKQEKFFRDIENLKSKKEEPLDLSVNYDFFKVQKAEDLPSSKIVTQDLSQFFKPLEQSKEAIKYLNSRGFTLNDIKNLGKWYFGTCNLEIEGKLYKTKNAIIIPLYFKGKMYGFYSRNIFEKSFYTYVNTNNVGFKIWNWFNIDISKPVYIFEGIFDALSAYKSGLTNVIACMGANIPNERIKELKEPVFCLDNDKTGLNNILNYSKNYKVCIWNNKFKDANEMLLNNLDVKSEILNNLSFGIQAQIKIRSKL